MSDRRKPTGCLTSGKETIAFTKSLCDAVGITISVSASAPAPTGSTGASQGFNNQALPSPSLQQSTTIAQASPSTTFTGLAHRLVGEIIWQYALLGIALAFLF